MKGRGLSAIRKSILVLVSAASIVLLAAETFLVLGLAKEMREQVGGQFNEEQLVIARHISSSIQRELGFLKKEILLLEKEIAGAGSDLDTYEERMVPSHSPLSSWCLQRVSPGDWIYRVGDH